MDHGFASIGALSRNCGNEGMGTEYRYRRDENATEILSRLTLWQTPQASAPGFQFERIHACSRSSVTAMLRDEPARKFR